MSAQEIYKIIIQHRVDTYQHWDTNNPQLRLGEVGFIVSPANLPEGANSTRALFIGDGTNNFAAIYENNNEHANVFFSGVGAGYVLPKGETPHQVGDEWQEGVLGGLIPHQSYFVHNTTGNLIPLYYSTAGSITIDGTEYAHQWIFDPSTYVEMTGAHIHNLITETETQMHTRSELFYIHSGEVVEDVDVMRNAIPQNPTVQTSTYTYTQTENASDLVIDGSQTAIVDPIKYSYYFVLPDTTFPYTDQSLVTITKSSSYHSGGAYGSDWIIVSNINFTDIGNNRWRTHFKLNHAGLNTLSYFRVETSEGYFQEFSPSASQVTLTYENNFVTLQIPAILDGSPTGARVYFGVIDGSLAHDSLSIQVPDKFKITNITYNIVAEDDTTNNKNTAPMITGSYNYRKTITYNGDYKDIYSIGFDIQYIGTETSTVVQAVSGNTITTTIVIPAEMCRDTSDSSHYAKSTLPFNLQYSIGQGGTVNILPADHLEGIALYNYREKTSSESRRPYAVLGIDNNGDLMYSLNYQGTISSSSDIKRILFYDADSASGVLKYDALNHTTTGVALSSFIFNGTTYNPLDEEDVSIGINYCETILNYDDSATALNGVVDISSLACKSIEIWEDGAPIDRYDVSNGTIVLDLSVYTAEDNIMLHNIANDLDYDSSASGSHLIRINSIEDDITALQNTSINSLILDGNTFTPIANTITAYSKTALLQDANNTININWDDTAHAYTITHPNISGTFDPEPSNNGVVTKIAVNQRGHVEELRYDTLGSLAFSNAPALSSSAANGTYVLKAIKTSSGITYQWVLEQ